MLILTSATLATVDELFRYKALDIKIPEFPGYTLDQWGIKAHNRPWVVQRGHFQEGQKVIEIGGAYSLLLLYLAKRFHVEAWNADDFGLDEEGNWSRWGDPLELPKKYPEIKYVFEKFGRFSNTFPDEYFDRIITISTLEHIPKEKRLNLLKDMHRCLKPGGMELHTIDISYASIKRTIMNTIVDRLVNFVPALYKIPNIQNRASEINHWIFKLKSSGVIVKTSLPSMHNILDRRILSESPDVIYRFYPPNNEPKPYYPSASLLLVIEDK